MSPATSLHLRRLVGATALASTLAACGSATEAATPAATSPATAAAVTTEHATAPAASGAAVGGPGSAAVTADANTASADEITAALDAAGVANASRWAREVEEYRPYPTDDSDLTRLQQNLEKYNPGEDTLARILSALTV